MRTPLERIRLGAFLLAMVLVGSVIGYHFLDPDTHWLDDLYMVVITVSSVGFTERPDTTWQFQLFTIGVIVFGMSAAVYTIGGFLQLITVGEIDRVLGVRKMAQGIQRLDQHVIICGFGRMGRRLASELGRERRSFVVVENRPEAAEDASRDGHLVQLGDAREEDVLRAAGVERCRVLVTALPVDADNVFITLTGRNLNPGAMIIARGEHPSTTQKLRQAGANRVVMPTAIGAQRMATMITRPSTGEFLELVADDRVMDVELDELTVTAGSPLLERSVDEIVADWPHTMLIVAVKMAGGKMVFRPEPDYRLAAGDTVILMGQSEDVARFVAAGGQ
ncbi:MAG: potassium channel protein [Planctomycetota bacterium]|nr:MAG: potassium channel protein [Planctomycetota bacterium]REJ96343.1 MAG: potassium channel protein [Planctomycetota bacterium]REK18724.1 MAG: potassium channel protein [Planctomycetota bacterium]REK49110.1 MAG: potassium channel protein [Planctomycetota bacterium]